MSWFYFKSKKQFWLTLLSGNLVIAFCGLLPILIALTAGTIASSYGCQANEAGAHPCVIGGIDYGNAISSMVVFGWLFLISMPLGAIGLILWTIRCIAGFKFIKRATRYALSELSDLAIKGYANVEARVWHQGEDRQITIFFEDRKQEQRFTQRKGNMIAGILEEKTGKLTLIKTCVY